MKGRLIALDHLNGREAAALMVDGVLHDLIVETDDPITGTIYRGVAERPVKGQGGMFFKTPDGNAFLRQVGGIAPGDRMLLQVTGHAEDGKAIPVTNKILFKSRYAIITPDAPGLNISRQIRDEDRRDFLMQIAHGEMQGSDFGLILRSSCTTADQDDIGQDIAEMRALAEQVLADKETTPEVMVAGDGPHAMAWREWTEDAQFDNGDGSFERNGILDQIDALQQDHITTGAADYFIEPTRAFVAVDVNTRGDTSPAAGLKANIAMARDLPRQLRLRGLGGQIVIDPAPMPKKDRRQFEISLRAAFKGDAVETNLVGWTAMGLFELQRQRARARLAF